MDSVEHSRDVPASNPSREPDRRSSSGRDILPDAVLACAADLTLQLQDGAGLDALRAAVFEYTRVVRRHGVPPERALAAFKFMTFNLPVIASRPAERRTELVHQLTQMAIEEYYGGAR